MIKTHSAEVISPPNSVTNTMAEAHRQRVRWRILTLAFVIPLLASLSYVWLRPAIYQSQTLIHFAYDRQLDRNLAEVPLEQLDLNERRFNSINLLIDLSQALQQRGIPIEFEEVQQIVSTQAEPISRTITLYATGTSPEVLAPTLATWLDLYRRQYESSNQESALEALTLTQEKLEAVEEEIRAQKVTLETFSETHNIVSLQRDENRALSKIKSLSTALDQATQAQTSAEASLLAFAVDEEAGRLQSHPDDQPILAQQRNEISRMEAELATLSKRYTEAFMNLDPAIVELRENLSSLKTSYQTALQDSHKRQQLSLQNAITTAGLEQQKLNDELRTHEAEARQFSRQLSDYESLNAILEELEAQGLMLRNQLIEQQISKPFDARVKLLEAPFTPRQAIGPNYWGDSLIALLASALFALLALLLREFVVREKPQSNGITTYNLIPGAAGLDQHAQGYLPPQHARLEGHANPALLPSSNGEHSGTLRTTSTWQRLYQHASKLGKVYIGLSLCGVAPRELSVITANAFDTDQLTLDLQGPHRRELPLPAGLMTLLQSYLPHQAQGPLWPALGDVGECAALLNNAAIEAGLQEKVSPIDLRLSYLHHLLAAGAALPQLENVAGEIDATMLSRLRGLPWERGENPEIDTIFPLQWDEQ